MIKVNIGTECRLFQLFFDGYLPFFLFSIAITETKSSLFENYLWSVPELYKIFIHHSASWYPFGLECTLNFNPRMRTTWFLFTVCSSRNAHEYVLRLLTLLCASFWGRPCRTREVYGGVDPLDHPAHLPLHIGSWFLNVAVSYWVKSQVRGSRKRQTASPNYLQKSLLVLILNFPLVIFVWCTWCNPSILYQTSLLYCWNSHLPPSTCLFTLVALKGTSQEPQHIVVSAVWKQKKKKNQSLPQWVNCSDEVNLQDAWQETRNKHWGLEGKAFQSYKPLSLPMPLYVNLLLHFQWQCCSLVHLSACLPAMPKIKFMDGDQVCEPFSFGLSILPLLKRHRVSGRFTPTLLAQISSLLPCSCRFCLLVSWGTFPSNAFPSTFPAHAGAPRFLDFSLPRQYISLPLVHLLPAVSWQSCWHHAPR